MSFPDKRFANPAEFADAYFTALHRATATVDRDQIRAAAQLLEDAHRRRASIFACGNGGSAAIANHLVCDHCKGVATDTALRPIVVSLSANVEIITAIANDIAFAEIFAYQLRAQARPGDVIMAVSASGESENIVRAVEWARDNGVKVIAMTGLCGGAGGQGCRCQSACRSGQLRRDRGHPPGRDAHPGAMAAPGAHGSCDHPAADLLIAETHATLVD